MAFFARWRGDREAEGARLLIECGIKSPTEGSNPSLSAMKIQGPIPNGSTPSHEDRGLKQRNLATLTLAGLVLLAGCSAFRDPVPSGARAQGDDEGPAYFTQSTDYGYRYAHNWVNRPCFTVDLPGSDWILQSATADYVMWHKGDYALKLYLTDNRTSAFAVGGMSGDQALQAFIGYELDYIRPKFEKSSSPPPSLRNNETGIWALWRWEGRIGRRAGVGKAQPAEQRHLLASLWLDPWVLSFDWATSDLDSPDVDSPELLAAVRSIHFVPQCFPTMRSGETWAAPGTGGGAHLGNERPPVQQPIGSQLGGEPAPTF